MQVLKKKQACERYACLLWRCRFAVILRLHSIGGVLKRSIASPSSLHLHNLRNGLQRPRRMVEADLEDCGETHQVAVGRCDH